MSSSFQSDFACDDIVFDLDVALPSQHSKSSAVISQNKLSLVDKDVPADKSAGHYVSNDEAAEMLRTMRASVRPVQGRYGYRITKRTLDIGFSGLAIAVDSPGAPIYKQRRVGRLNPDGSFRMFSMYKFRTMAKDVDRQLEGLQSRNDADGPMFRINEGIGRCGSRLRWWSLVRSWVDAGSGTNPVRIVRAGSCGALAPALLGA